MTLYRLNNTINPLLILRMAEDERSGIYKGFTDNYLSKGIADPNKLLRDIDDFEVKEFLSFASEVLHMDIDIYDDFDILKDCISDRIQQNVFDRARLSILTLDEGLCSVVVHEDTIKDRLEKMMVDVVSGKNGTEIDFPSYLKRYCGSRLRYWINNAFLANEMHPGREYIVEGDVILSS